MKNDIETDLMFAVTSSVQNELGFRLKLKVLLDMAEEKSEPALFMGFPYDIKTISVHREKFDMMGNSAGVFKEEEERVQWLGTLWEFYQLQRIEETLNQMKEC